MNFNEDGYDGFTLDIEIYKNYGNGYWAQAKYLVHGYDDVLWTNSIKDAINFLEFDLERLDKKDI